ncbi:MAG TPA: hypothetical protein VN179_00555 [Solirubrobacterales bacterium]|nr:hypothetical protein [Solirubrobacterales bacterium]
MRQLPLLLVLLLLTVLVAAASVQASPLSLVAQPAPFASVEDEEDEAEDEEWDDSEWEEAELCEPEEVAEELCEEEEPAPKAKGKKDDECLLKGAKAAVTANPGKRRLRLTVRYRTWKPATVSVEASLQGPKGAVRLGTDHARFQRSGVYRETYELPEKRMKKALAANGFTVDLHVVNTPPSCSLELTGASRRAKH